MALFYQHYFFKGDMSAVTGWIILITFVLPDSPWLNLSIVIGAKWVFTSRKPISMVISVAILLEQLI